MEQDSDQLVLPLIPQEYLQIFPKVVQLIEEFGLLPPTEQTYLEVKKMAEQGLPLVKSLYEDATLHLFKEGKLLSEHDRQGEGFNVIYASILLNKGYGPITLVLSPEIMMEGRFEAYCIDHASTYLSDRVNEHMSSSVVSSAEIQDIENDLMEKYTLNPQEFFVFYSYCVASLCENEEEYFYDDSYEERLRFLTFDIGLPEIKVDDLLAVICKQGWGDQVVDEDNLRDICTQKDKAFLTVGKRDYGSQSLYSQEVAITSKLMEQFQIPMKYREKMNQVA
ncbi:MAG TPA: hypothetical protein PKJ26_02195 [Candidatus Woesebacteria bacterium]|nr:hypothetical protein [Candidatus Woesebacteria bacterium]